MFIKFFCNFPVSFFLFINYKKNLMNTLQLSYHMYKKFKIKLIFNCKNVANVCDIGRVLSTFKHLKTNLYQYASIKNQSN